MQNQAAVEALYSATFVEDYLDCVENLPNDLQRHLSRLREFDLTQYSEFLRDLDSLVEAFEKEKTAAGQRQVLAKIQLGLIAAQDIGDDKLATVQALTDIIEDKTRLLKHDAEILNFNNNDDDDSNQAASSSAAAGAGKSNQTQGKPPKRQGDEKNDKSSSAKRRKKASSDKGRDKGGGDAGDEDGSSSSGRAKGSNQWAQRSSGGGGGSSSSSNKKVAKRRREASKKEKDDSDHDVDPSNVNDFDPNEPTYCLCDQVSFGEMVCCDNDLCPYEWFHFECVHLTNKPKGKWYCPRCRGDKVSVMKPKAQFLKELEKFNKEKEAKMLMRQLKR